MKCVFQTLTSDDLRWPQKSIFRKIHATSYNLSYNLTNFGDSRNSTPLDPRSDEVKLSPLKICQVLAQIEAIDENFAKMPLSLRQNCQLLQMFDFELSLPQSKMSKYNKILFWDFDLEWY